MGLTLSAQPRLNCISWRNEWMTMRGERQRLLRRHRRMLRGLDARAVCLHDGFVSACADGQRLPSEDVTGVSAAATAGDEHGRESQQWSRAIG
jgi:hypothetical protein